MLLLEPAEIMCGSRGLSEGWCQPTRGQRCHPPPGELQPNLPRQPVPGVGTCGECDAQSARSRAEQDRIPTAPGARTGPRLSRVKAGYRTSDAAARGTTHRVLRRGAGRGCNQASEGAALRSFAEAGRVLSPARGIALDVAFGRLKWRPSPGRVDPRSLAAQYGPRLPASITRPSAAPTGGIPRNRRTPGTKNARPCARNEPARMRPSAGFSASGPARPRVPRQFRVCSNWAAVKVPKVIVR